ncbi:MAG TPA: hypothetical protein VHQ94_02560 [Pyrinomonadaceae bacterium]|jgi:hypothetical protein|nr:hypothetical protein [Pyrinomonadaceae bacterium]
MRWLGMKWRVMALGFALTATASIAQTVQSPPDPSKLEVMKFSWGKERIGWEKDPFGGPIENFDEVRARTRNERRIDEAKRGGSAEVDKLKREAKADAANIEAKHKQPPSRYVFVYKTTVKNLSDKAIKSIDWDYVFFERGTENELGRREFTSEEKISPGKSKELTVTITKPPTQTISLTALNTGERASLDERVVIVRIDYADGTSWQRPM